MPFTFIGDSDIGSTCQLTLTEAIMIGLIPGTSSGVSSGYVATSATSTVAIRATAYTVPGTAAQRSVKSANAADAAAGTGAQQVKITYFDGSLNGPFTEVVTLNGVTGVNTVATNIAYIEKLEVVRVGTGGSNAGIISLMTLVAGGGTTIGSIIAGDNRTFWAHHYVPPGITSFVNHVIAAGSAVAGFVTLNTFNPIDATVAQSNPTGILRHGTTAVTMEFPIPFGVPGPAIVFVNERPDAATASTAFGSFGYIDLS